MGGVYIYSSLDSDVFAVNKFCHQMFSSDGIGLESGLSQFFLKS